MSDTTLTPEDTTPAIVRLWQVMLEERLKTGCLVNIYTVKNNDTFSGLDIGDIAKATAHTNVVLNEEAGTLIFLAPNEQMEFTTIGGILLHTNHLKVGEVTLGGAVIAGTDQGDVVFTDHTLILSYPQPTVLTDNTQVNTSPVITVVPTTKVA